MNGNFPDHAISLYFHIPFCTKKCDYCHFYVLPDREVLKQQLLEGLRLEWEMRLPSLAGKSVASIYFGGGTPALFGPERIAKVLQWIKNALPAAASEIEITLEANPENISHSLMADYAAAGINRVSIGVQSLDDSLLPLLGRSHDAKRAIDAVWDTKQAGISNISVDLMYDLPGQSLASWNKTLTQAGQLPIDHLSLYNLTIEPHTVFFKKREALKPLLPREEVSLEMYQSAVETLESFGLKQYEISAFAKDRAYSRHNVGYWTARPFLGLGPSAFSYWEGKRFQNIPHQNKYHKMLLDQKEPVHFEEALNEKAKRRELFAIQLRLLEGVDLARFQCAHGGLDEEAFAVLAQLTGNGLLVKELERYTLTKRGTLFYDTVAEELVLI